LVSRPSNDGVDDDVEGVEEDDGLDGVVEDCAQDKTGALKTTSNDARQ